jgi:hypothetical protein
MVPENEAKIVPNPTPLENAGINETESPQRLTNDPDFALDKVPSEEEAVHEYMAEGKHPRLPRVGKNKLPKPWGSIILASWFGILTTVAIVRQIRRKK